MAGSYSSVHISQPNGWGFCHVYISTLINAISDANVSCSYLSAKQGCPIAFRPCCFSFVSTMWVEVDVYFYNNVRLASTDVRIV